MVVQLFFTGLFLMALLSVSAYGVHSKAAAEKSYISSEESIEHFCLIHLPSDSNPACPIVDRNSETELEEEEVDSDDDDTDHPTTFTDAVVSAKHSEISGLTYLKLFQNHNDVSLFILYHSWKSYLS
jgi:hypothetical protein